MKRIWAAIAVLMGAAILIAGCTKPPENKNPTALMTPDKYIIFVDDSVEFNASPSSDPDGSVNEYNWDFGDGSPATMVKEKTATHKFSKAGAFNISLWVKDDKDGKSNTVTTMVVVVPKPTASMDIADTFSPINFSVDTTSLANLTIEYSWNFGDGANVSKGASVNHSYRENGTYKVSLMVTWQTYQVTITPPLSVAIRNQPPVAHIDVSSGPYFSNKAITFNGTLSGDPDGNVVKYAWDFGDGGTDLNATVDHSFLMPGPYTVKLTVTDNDNAVANATLTVTVEKDLIIQDLTITNFTDPGGYVRMNLSFKIENKGSAKGPGTINVTVSSYNPDKSNKIDTNWTTNSGTWEPGTADNSITVREVLPFSNVDSTWYKIELFYNGTLIFSDWYPK